MDWGETIPLKAWMEAVPSLFEARLPLFEMGQSHNGCALIKTRISLFVHSLGGPDLGLYM